MSRSGRQQGLVFDNNCLKQCHKFIPSDSESQMLSGATRQQL